MNLALAGGYVADPGDMLRSMRPSTLGLWMALYQIDPWDANRSDLSAGVIASTIANVNRDPKRKAEAYTPAEFMPYREAQRSDADRKSEAGRKLKAMFSRLEKTGKRK